MRPAKSLYEKSGEDTTKEKIQANLSKKIEGEKRQIESQDIRKEKYRATKLHLHQKLQIVLTFENPSMFQPIKRMKEGPPGGSVG